MLYTLNENVYLVKGKARSCIYDLNNSKLYSVNNALAEKIEQANTKGIDIHIGDKNLKNILDEFIRIGLFILAESVLPKKIDDIKKYDDGCIFAWIEITNRCNLRCLHCYNESDVRCDKVMSLDNYKKVINDLVKMNVKKIQLIGGEPLFEKNLLKDMLAYTVGKFSFIEIFTNGTLFSEDWFDYLAENDIHIALSVYSYNENEHDKVTKMKGSWIRTNQTIEELKKRNITYRVCNVLMKDVDLGEKNTNLYELSSEKDIVRVSGRADFSLLSDELIRKKLITKQTFQKPIQRDFCCSLVSGHNCFKNKIYISADMKVYPCVMERRVMHCEISDNKEIVLKDSIQNLNKDKIKECSDCEFRYACYDCRPNSLSGDILEKPWYCTYNPQLGVWEDVDEFIINLKNQWEN
ncbi:MAG: radical SAM protein [Lachnospiraceae bacterium]|nr:radical SAM protein [Lachnospiraceae bacterium]